MELNKSIRRQIYYCFVCMLLIISATDIAFCQTPGLPTDAKEAINKGITAAKIPDYPLAIKYFEEARKAAPQSPEVFFNMGLAESKIPGRELRAICWFGAYLTANPNAANAAAVKEQISSLFVINQSNTNRFLKTLQDAAVQLPVKTDLKGKREYLKEVSLLWTEAGDNSAAINAANLNEIDYRSANYYYITELQTERGDFTGAQSTSELIEETYLLFAARSKIAKGFIKVGDSINAKKYLVLAQETAARLEKDYEKERAQVIITEVQGQIINAKEESSSYTDYRSSLEKWLEQLGIFDYGSSRGIYQTNLNQGIFLDLTASLNAIKSSLPSAMAHENEQMESFRHTEGEVYFDMILQIGKEMVKGQNIIARMLKEQAKK